MVPVGLAGLATTRPLRPCCRVQLGDLLDGGLEPGLRAGRDLDHLAAQRGEHVAVAGVARPGHRDPVADLERREEREQEPAAAAGGHDDLVGVDVDAVRPLVVAGDRLAQLEDPDRGRVAERVGALQQPDRLVADRRRRPAARLAGQQVEQVAVGAPPLRCRRQQVHDVERRHVGAARHLPAVGGRRHGGRLRVCGFPGTRVLLTIWAEISSEIVRLRRLPGDPDSRVPTRPAPEERPLAELGAGAVAGAVLGDVRGTRAGGVQATDHGAVGPLHLAVDGRSQAAEGEAGVQRLPEGEVVGAPRTGVLRRQPVGVLVEVGVLAAGGVLVVAVEGGDERAGRAGRAPAPSPRRSPSRRSTGTATSAVPPGVRCRRSGRRPVRAGASRGTTSARDSCPRRRTARRSGSRSGPSPGPTAGRTAP